MASDRCTKEGLQIRQHRHGTCGSIPKSFASVMRSDSPRQLPVPAPARKPRTIRRRRSGSVESSACTAWMWVAHEFRCADREGGRSTAADQSEEAHTTGSARHLAGIFDWSSVSPSPLPFWCPCLAGSSQQAISPWQFREMSLGMPCCRGSVSRSAWDCWSHMGRRSEGFKSGPT